VRAARGVEAGVGQRGREPLVAGPEDDVVVGHRHQRDAGLGPPERGQDRHRRGAGGRVEWVQRGASRVHAVDVGAGQLDWRLRNDPRVAVHEGINARNLRFEDIGERADLATLDLAFISVTLILPAVVPLLRPEGRMVILVKPQFEVGKGQVGKGGIVRQPELHRDACARVEDAVRHLGYETSSMESPILGAEGNKEFLLYARH